MTSYRPEVRRRVLRRLSGAELKERVREATAAQVLRAAAKVKIVAVEEEEEEESSAEVELVYDVDQPDFDPPSSLDNGAGSAAAPVAAAC